MPVPLASPGIPQPDKPAVCLFPQLQLFPIISRIKHRVNSCVDSHLLTLKFTLQLSRTAPLDPLYKLHDGNYQHTQKKCNKIL